MLQVQNRQIRAALKLQVWVTAACAVVAAGLMGVHGGGSALLGGLVSFTAGAVYGAMLPDGGKSGGKNSAGDALVGMMRAEAAKIVAIVLLLWLVFSAYKEVIGIVFIGVFIITTVIFSLAFFIRPKEPPQASQ